MCVAVVYDVENTAHTSLHSGTDLTCGRSVPSLCPGVSVHSVLSVFGVHLCSLFCC